MARSLLREAPFLKPEPSQSRHTPLLALVMLLELLRRLKAYDLYRGGVMSCSKGRPEEHATCTSPSWNDLFTSRIWIPSVSFQLDSIPARPAPVATEAPARKKRGATSARVLTGLLENTAKWVSGAYLPHWGEGSKVAVQECEQQTTLNAATHSPRRGSMLVPSPVEGRVLFLK